MAQKKLTCRLYPTGPQAILLGEILEHALSPEEFTVVEDAGRISSIELRGQRIRARAANCLGDFLPKRGLAYRNRRRWHWLIVCEVRSE